MPSLKSSLLAAAVLAAYVNQAFAAPTSPSISTQLFARHVTNINNCDQHQRDTINLALGEMRRLALKAQTITVDNNAYVVPPFALSYGSLELVADPNTATNITS